VYREPCRLELLGFLVASSFALEGGSTPWIEGERLSKQTERNVRGKLIDFNLICHLYSC
jgi:hypothetical protein